MLVSALSAVLIATCISVSSVLATTISFNRQIDNDPTSEAQAAGYSTIGKNYTYFSASGCFNGDARKAVSNPDNTYFWYHPISSFPINKKVTVGIQPYLNSSSFKDPSAAYTVLVNGVFETVCTVNQNKAPGGWSPVTYTSFANMPKGNQICLVPSNNPNLYTGADAIKVYYSYDQ